MKNRNNKLLIITIIFLGVFARFAVMQIGHNYDFDSYCIVGQLVNEGKSVYANTARYNYGFIFFLIQGLLYKISLLFSDNITVYRILIVSILTLTDLLISFFIYKKKNIKTALLFFINPISIIISGYHNQFDNIAILLGLMTICFYNEDEKINAKDFFFIAFASLSLITKHIFAFFPIFILFNKTISFKKKLLYAFVPPLIFFMSFIPFALSSKEALMGIVNNVFLYRSFNNYPFFYVILRFINISNKVFLIIYLFLLIIISIIVKKKRYSNLLYIYLISMVTFSSAIANQYLVIPIVGILMIDNTNIKYIYLMFVLIFLLFNRSGFNFIKYLNRGNILRKCFSNGGYVISVCILFSILMMYLLDNKN